MVDITATDTLTLSPEVQLDRVSVPNGTFRMGSGNHYVEEAPVHRVTVDAFWIDRTQVTNRQFAEFVKATGHVTFAEIPPDPKDYPGALPHMLYAGSLVFSPPARQLGHFRPMQRALPRGPLPLLPES